MITLCTHSNNACEAQLYIHMARDSVLCIVRCALGTRNREPTVHPSTEFAKKIRLCLPFDGIGSLGAGTPVGTGHPSPAAKHEVKSM